MPIMSTNFAKMLVWKHEYGVKLSHHKECTPNTYDHHMPLNEPLPMKIFCARHWPVSCRVLVKWLVAQK